MKVVKYPSVTKNIPQIGKNPFEIGIFNEENMLLTKKLVILSRVVNLINTLIIKLLLKATIKFVLSVSYYSIHISIIIF